ncbi:hypothetical protein [Thioalkalivibrio sp. ARh3]|uniref:hypothetical protein n=1 Tax=Thioalkalivibrio sp. ARh3 TaxID=1158148 RepID=UPI0003A3A81E|nr:hypothetical protein [Thioalkalivibrio sp. ARh3]
MAMMSDECGFGGLRFKSGEHCLQWAEEQLARVKCRGIYAQMVGGAGQVSWDEIQDCAQTILVALGEVGDHRAREAYRAVYGAEPSGGLQTLVAFVGDYLGKHLAGRRREGDYLETIGAVAVMRARQRGHGWKVAPRGAYARELGVTRQAIDGPGPKALIDAAEQVVATWVERGEREFLDVLRAKGVPV